MIIRYFAHYAYIFPFLVYVQKYDRYNCIQDENIIMHVYSQVCVTNNRY